MTESIKPIKRALISVSDKTGLVDFCASLVGDFGIELIATGGSRNTLQEANIESTEIASITGFPEMMDGRVKTLHPKVHGGILARRGIDEKVMEENEILPIDLVVVNLYPFIQAISKESVTQETAIENIDIGGPSMVRSAAKNNRFVGVVVDPEDYESVLKEMKLMKGSLSKETKGILATKAFSHTASYDSMISGYLSSLYEEDFPEQIFAKFKKKEVMRYGENPHQKAAFYTDLTYQSNGLANAIKLQGKQLSYNNIADSDTALECVRSFKEPTCVIIKHANPCGVATDRDITVAYQKAFEADSTSAFGGVIALNRFLEHKTAQQIINNQFVEVIIAPGISKSALKIFNKKENVRVLDVIQISDPVPEFKFLSITGGLLIQETDNGIIQDSDLTFVSSRDPSIKETQDCLFAWKVCKFVKSNAIVYAKNNQTIGVGAGQMSRVDSVNIAASKAKERGFETQGCTMASDAFFPFRDGIDVAASMGISSIIQPGGSIKDQLSIDFCDHNEVSMVFTGNRHFKH